MNSYAAMLGTGQCVIDATNTWVEKIYSEAAGTTAAGTWNNAEGIDLLANIVRHEDRHRRDLTLLWGAGNPYQPANDVDNDFLPTNTAPGGTERALGTPYVAGGYNPNQFLTTGVVDFGNYGVGDNDCDDYRMHRQDNWVKGAADIHDWANPGHQY